MKAAARKRPDGKYDVDLVVTAKKIARRQRRQREAKCRSTRRSTSACRTRRATILLLEKRRIKSGENRFTIEVAGEPAKAGIDPLDKLIDRDAGDNTVEVTKS